METEGSFPYSPKPATWFYYDPDQFTLSPPSCFLKVPLSVTWSKPSFSSNLIHPGTPNAKLYASVLSPILATWTDHFIIFIRWSE
jgi:hypothetical protein